MDYREMKWTEQQGKIAKQLCAEGKTATQIAAVVKKTRNAVIGYLHRNGIRMGEGRRPPVIQKPKVERKPKVIHRKVEKSERKPPILSFEPIWKKKVGDMGIPFLKAGHNQCRYVVNTSPAMVCGEPTKTVSCSWCEEHYEIVFQRPEPRPLPQKQNDRTPDRRLGRH
jgi:hypothetical protein